MLNKAQAKNVRNWVKALRSGKFKQGFRQLQTEEGEYCCLGVATRLLTPDWRLAGAYPSLEVREAYGMTMQVGFNVDDPYSFGKALTAVNDSIAGIAGAPRDYSNVLPYIIAWYNKNKPKGLRELNENSYVKKGKRGAA